MNSLRDVVFSPAFGNRPTSLVGRSPEIKRFLAGLEERPGSKERATIVLGQRGFGKTVLLWEMADRAREKGFAVANPTTVREGMVGRIVEKLAEDATRFLPENKAKVSGGSIGALGFSAGLQFSREAEPLSDEARLTQLCRELSGKGVGALLLVDELQANSAEVRRLVTTYQELVGEGLNVAIALAGLPSSASGVLNDKVLTFVNRARKIELTSLPIGEVDAFMKSAFEKCKVKVSRGKGREAAELSQGSPYLMQLIGHNIVLYAADDGSVDDESFDDAIKNALDEYGNDVGKTTLAALSRKDVEYLQAMSELGGECLTSDVARKMNVSADYAQQYRRRLIEAGIIRAPRQGIVEFAVPLLDDYLKSLRALPSKNSTIHP